MPSVVIVSWLAFAAEWEFSEAAAHQAVFNRAELTGKIIIVNIIAVHTSDTFGIWHTVLTVEAVFK